MSSTIRRMKYLLLVSFAIGCGPSAAPVSTPTASTPGNITSAPTDEIARALGENSLNIQACLPYQAACVPDAFSGGCCGELVCDAYRKVCLLRNGTPCETPPRECADERACIIVKPYTYKTCVLNHTPSCVPTEGAGCSETYDCCSDKGLVCSNRVCTRRR